MYPPLRPLLIGCVLQQCAAHSVAFARPPVSTTEDCGRPSSARAVHLVARCGDPKDWAPLAPGTPEYPKEDDIPLGELIFHGMVQHSAPDLLILAASQEHKSHPWPIGGLVFRSPPRLLPVLQWLGNVRIQAEVEETGRCVINPPGTVVELRMSLLRISDAPQDSGIRYLFTTYPPERYGSCEPSLSRYIGYWSFDPAVFIYGIYGVPTAIGFGRWCASAGLRLRFSSSQIDVWPGNFATIRDGDRTYRLDVHSGVALDESFHSLTEVKLPLDEEIVYSLSRLDPPVPAPPLPPRPAPSPAPR
jgi:hypothetical protein